MMKFLTIVVLFCTNFIFSQGPFLIENKAPWLTTKDLGVISFYSNSLGWMTSAKGTIFKTSDGAVTWQEISTGFDTDGLIPPDKLLILDDQNLILRIVISGFPDFIYQWIRSSDGGLSWTDITPSDPYLISDIYPAGNKLVAVGNDSLVMSSNNRGTTWDVLQYTPGSGYSNNNIFFIDHMTGWYSGSSSDWEFNLFRTNDGGLTWNIVSNNYFGTNLKFFNAQTGISLEGERLIKTTDGGENWNVIFEEMYLVTFFAADENNIYVSTGLNENAGGQPVIHYTTNGGINWELSDYYDGNFRINGITGVNSQIYITGEKGYLAVSDNGTNFKPLMGDYITGIHAFGDRAIAVSYTGEIYFISGGGDTWIQSDDAVAKGTNYITFTDEMTGYIIGEYIWRTTDAGNSWELTNFGTEFHKPVHSFDVDRNGVLYIEKNDEDPPRIFRTPDAGLTWLEVNLPAAYDGYEREFFPLDSLNIWASGISEELYRTTNGGTDWQHVSYQIRGFSFLDQDSGIGFNVSDPVFTADGGTTWAPLPSSNGGIDYYEVFQKQYYDINNLYILQRGEYLPGDESIHPFMFKVYQNSEFTEVLSCQSKIMASFSFSDKNNGWIAAGREVFKLTGNDITSSDDILARIPEYFQLEQNYPNPFNPSTTIRFNLPDPEYVTLKIYDMLGNEIKTLIQKDYEAGSYEVSFNASGIASGNYFYRITAGNYSSVKKLQLLK